METGKSSEVCRSPVMKIDPRYHLNFKASVVPTQCTRSVFKKIISLLYESFKEDQYQDLLPYLTASQISALRSNPPSGEVLENFRVWIRGIDRYKLGGWVSAHFELLESIQDKNNELSRVNDLTKWLEDLYVKTNGCEFEGSELRQILLANIDNYKKYLEWVSKQ